MFGILSEEPKSLHLGIRLRNELVNHDVMVGAMFAVILVLFLCFNGISTFGSYFMPKPSLNYLIHCKKDEEVHAFPKGISPKINVITRLEFKLANFKVAVEHFSNYVMGTPHGHFLSRS